MRDAGKDQVLTEEVLHGLDYNSSQGGDFLGVQNPFGEKWVQRDKSMKTIGFSLTLERQLDEHLLKYVQTHGSTKS